MKRILPMLLAPALCIAAPPIYHHGRLVKMTDYTRESATGSGGIVYSVPIVEYRLSVATDDGMILVGSYTPKSTKYVPKDFIVKDPVDYRVDGEYMFIKRPNGTELKTEIVRRERQ
jgi:hypothetical protein